MRTGELRHRVTIRKKVETDDGHGGWTDDDGIVATRVPACVTSLEGRALDRAREIDPRATHVVSVPYRTGIASGQEVVFHDGRAGDRVFEIVGPPIDRAELHRELVLTCREAA